MRRTGPVNCVPLCLINLLIGLSLLANPVTGILYAQSAHKKLEPRELIPFKQTDLSNNIETKPLTLNKSTSSPLEDADKVQIDTPKTTGEIWLNNPTKPLISSETKIILKTPTKGIGSLLKLDSDDEQEIGFLSGQKPNQKPTLTHIDKLMIANKERYTFNFDGGSLLYFNMPQLAGAIYANPKLVNSYFNKNAVPSTKNESVLLSSNAKKHIIENSINMAGILEANHIILKNNQIILDTKLNDVNNESEVVYQLNEAINSLNEHASVH